MPLDLPLELVEQILLRLPLPDLVRLTTLSSSFRDLIHSSHLLWTHHLQAWNLLGVSADADGSPNNLEKFKERYLCVRELDEHLDNLSHEHIHSPVVEIDLEHERILSCVRDPTRREITYKYLSSILLSPNKFTALTSKLYSRYFLIALTQAGVFQDLMRVDTTTPGGVFEGALLISRWVGACMSEPAVIQHVRPTECVPVHETIEEIVNKCRDQLAPSASIEEVLGVINKVLYRDFGLRKNAENYHDFDNNRVDKVLYKKTGIPITIAIVYHEVGSRLGLTLNLVNFPRHFLLSFRDSAGTTLYIDCFNDGDVLTRAQCLQLCPMANIDDKDYYFQTTSSLQVMVRLINNFIAFGQIVPIHHDRAFFALNLFKIMSYLAPNDYESAVHAMNLSLDLRIKCNFLKKFSCIEPDIWSKYCRRVGQAAESLKEHLTIKRTKPEHVRFAIGSVMLHRRYNYTCVLYGWDEACTMSESWQRRMGISQLENQANQPYYKVLADDDSERYVAQENLLETRSEFIGHRDVGKYFSLYDGERFVPNAALKTIYTYLNND